MNNLTGDNSTVDSDDNDDLLDTMNRVQVIVTPILLVLGITGNILIVITVSDRQFGQLSIKYTLKALAVSDSVLLLTNVFNQHFTRIKLGFDVRAFSTIGCKLFFFAYRVGKMSASWFIVLIAVERFVAVLFPLHVRFITTKRNILIAIVCVYVYLATITGVWVHVSTDVVGGTCLSDVVTKETAPTHKIFVIIGGLSYSLVPIMILLVITPPIVYKLLTQRRRQQELTNHVQHGSSAQNFSRITAMLIGIVFWYIVCVIPITLVLVLTFWTNKSIFETRDPTLIVFVTIAQTFEQINHSSNFFIYVLLSQQFRERFLVKVRCKQMPPPQPPSVWSSYLERFNES